MTLQGQIRNGVVVLLGGGSLPDGTLVEVTPRNNLAAVPEPAAAASVPISKERRQALLSLIGICKTDHPPSDEDVEWIIEAYRIG
jgi:hypothetical protein